MKYFIKVLCWFIPFKNVRHYLKHKYVYFNGYDNKWTRQIYKQCECGKDLWCGGPTFLNDKCELADRVCFNGCQVHGTGKLKIGCSFHSGIELLIITSNHNYDNGKHIPYSPKDNIAKDVVIGDAVWCGSRVTILPGTHIGNGVIIQAGSVVHGDIPHCAIIGGNPAQIIKYRNKDHFYKLYKQGRFN